MDRREAPAVTPEAALGRIAHILERRSEPTYRVRAFLMAAARVRELGAAGVAQHIAAGTLRTEPGIGPVTAQVIQEAFAGDVPDYLYKLESVEDRRIDADAQALRAELRGDCHTHSDWSDGGSPIEEMAVTARALGHEYMVLTDHSPRLTIARGLSSERLVQQLELVRVLNEQLAPFRILTGIEVDILEDGTLDQDPALLARLDVVVASVHSKLRMPSTTMTPRMVRAIRDPNTDILGHCTGRIVVGRGRPESTFDADRVFTACRENDVAVEVNSRPERLDPPRRLLRQAINAGCRLAIDTDAHAPGQLEWQINGCERAAECGADPAMVVNTLSAEALLTWVAGSRPS